MASSGQIAMPMLVEMLLVSGASLARAQGLQNGLGKAACRRRDRDARHQDRELVAAEARHHLAVGEHRGDTRRNGLKHRVAGRVAEQVVDFLEPVEVETEHGEAFALPARLAISWSIRALK